MQTGNFQTPPNTADADYPGGNIAFGVASVTVAPVNAGNPGFVKILW